MSDKMTPVCIYCKSTDIEFNIISRWDNHAQDYVATRMEPEVKCNGCLRCVGVSWLAEEDAYPDPPK